MSEAHMKRAAEWFLTLKEIPLDRAHQLIADTPSIRTYPEQEASTEGAALSPYDTGLDASEGLWLRDGWTGKG